jgi:alkaline phosphatase D
MLETDRVTPSADTDFTAKINLTELTPKTRYIYRAVVEGKQPGPLCQFVTAPVPDDPAPVTFVIGGDVRESFRPFTIMDEMRSAKPDFFIFLGDTIYSDKGKTAIQLTDYWAKYVENRDVATQRFLAQTSVFAMWDDHEVANDFSSTHPRMPIGRKAFFDYWPIRPDPQDPHRLYRSFRWGQAVELFLLDTRQYRDPAAQMMLGPVQKQWLKDSLAASPATIKFVVTSVPFSDPRKDKWGEYPQERDDILDFIGKKGIAGVVFLATDVHHAAVANVPGPLGLKELIFGPLATTMNYKINPNEPRFENFNDQSQNYGKISVKPGHPNLSVEVEWFDKFHNRLHRVEFGEVSSDNQVSVKPVK